MKSIEGRALVASPYLTDPNFLRTVVYIIRHDADGAFGLILNRPTSTTVYDVLKDIVGEDFKNRQPVFAGGPVDGPLLVLHDGDESSVYLAADQDEILRLCQSDHHSIRVFDGYSGWGPGQLESELQAGGWLVWDVDSESVFDDPENIWHRAVREIGHDILSEAIPTAHIPKDPAYN